MKDENIEFLEDYKKICVKHKKQILGFDDGAYVVDLGEDEYDLEALVFEEQHYPDNSVGNSGLHFASKDELKNSISSVKHYIRSTKTIKEELNRGSKNDTIL